jgi:Dolichyl-phosphate-mannose-protein mannosyltransferase
LQNQPDRENTETMSAARVVTAPRHKRRWLIGAVLLVALVAGAAWRIRRLANDPQVYFLSDEAGAEWIRADEPFSLSTYPLTALETTFQYTFTTQQPVDDAQLIVRAFDSAIVKLDGVALDHGKWDTDEWKKSRIVRLPHRVDAGRHVLQVSVSKIASHPCLWAHCDALGIRTGSSWQASARAEPFQPAVSVSQLGSPDVAREYPSVWESFRAIAPWLAGIFCVSFVWTLWNSQARGLLVNQTCWRLTPSRVRWLLLAGWVVLGLNNMWRVRTDMGFDVQQHYEYVVFISQYRALPLATDGWQMFQPPLFYLIATPCYSLFNFCFDETVVLKLMRFLPLLCGIAQIEIVYRAARVVFPDKDDLQIIAATVGGLLPMQIEIAQVFGNEPLAGCLTAGLILLCFRLLVEPSKRRSNRLFVGLGVLSGLAVLSKLTPVLLAPLIALVVIWQGRFEVPRIANAPSDQVGKGLAIRTEPGTWGAGFIRLGIVAAVCAVTAAWYFVRNWVYLGKPVIFGGTPESGYVWWQDPGYRTWQQLTTLGTAFRHPVYAGTRGLWDSLYSTMWLDGSISGTMLAPDGVPWNLRWMEAGAWLALVPMGLMIVGVLSVWGNQSAGTRRALLFAIAAILIYLAAIIDLYVRLPIYSTAKATYMVGLVPCFAVLTAAGAAPFLRYRLLRALVFSLLTCWAVAAYVAYFAH